MDYIGQPLFMGACALILGRFVVLTQHGKSYRGLISALACVMYIVCLFFSAHMQAAGLSGSKLLIAKVLGPADYSELNGLSFNWSVELVFVLIGEMAGIRIVGALAPGRIRAVRVGPLLDLGPSKLSACLFLVAVGLISTVLFRNDLSNRADGGQGLFTILKTCLVVGLCVIFFYHFFGKRLFLMVAALGVVVLLLSAVRSPLVAVGIAYFAGKVARGEITTTALARFAVMGFLIAVLGAAMSNYRGQIVAGRQGDLAESLADAISNPFASIYGGGIDTLDGYRLAQQIQPSEESNPANVLVAVTTFIPRAFWPNKPDDLSLDITYRYLHWNQGGIFLSIVGYLRIAFGGYVQALLAIMVMISFLSGIYQLLYKKVGGFIIILVTFRLFLAGSPFDVYYGLVIFLLWTIAYLLFKPIFDDIRPKRHRA